MESEPKTNNNDNNQVNQEDNLEQKKQYLTAEIINKNYNVNNFIDYCQKKKENGDDLTNWTLEELKQSVSEFQNEQQNNAKPTNKSSMRNFLFTNNNNDNNINNMNSQNYIKSINENIQSTNFDSQNVIYSQNNNSSTSPQDGGYKKEIQCKILEKTELNSKKINVEIKNPKTMTTSILSSSYTIYEIHTKEMNWTVYRRYSDFEWLRTILRKLFPRHLIPPLPGKKWATGDLILTL